MKYAVQALAAACMSKCERQIRDVVRALRESRRHCGVLRFVMDDEGEEVRVNVEVWRVSREK